MINDSPVTLWRAGLSEGGVASFARPSSSVGCVRFDGRHDAAADDHATQVGRTLADVERDLILGTLRHCHGNRTHAANILGISVRTMRNKLNEYAGQGVPVPPPHGDSKEPVRTSG